MAKTADISATDQLKEELRNLAGALGERAVTSIGDTVGGATDRLTEYAGNGGGPGLMAAVTGGSKLAQGESPAKAALSAGFGGLKEKVKGAFSKVGGGGGGGKNKVKMTNIVESIDVGVPRSVVYNQWTQFKDFPTFMKKVESVEQERDEKLNWRAQVFWSHRSWKSTICEQLPDTRIVWRSEGEKGRVDGAVTFHELAPELTRILLVLEYHPQGFFERTGNLWRAQGRRARLELKHFRRQVMNQTILHPDDVTGWRGEIRDGEVVRQDEDEPPDDDAEDSEEQGGDERASRDDHGEQDEYDEDDYAEEEDVEQDGRPDERRRRERAERQGSDEDAEEEGGEEDGHDDDAEDDDRDEPTERQARRQSGQAERTDRDRRSSQGRQHPNPSREQARREPARRG
jgi:uncharacterized membrane protein